MKRFPLKPATRLQLCFVAGMLVASPLWPLAYQLPMFKDWPLWMLIAFPVLTGVAGLIWFRECMSPDKTSFKPKWW